MSEQSLEWKCLKSDCGWTGTAPKRILDGIVACPDCGHSASMFCRAAEAVSGPPMSSDKREVNDPVAVPLVELLRDIPADARYVWTETDGLKATHFIPVGLYMHEAAQAISAHDAAVAGLEAERNERSAQLVAALARISQLEAEKAAANGLREGHALVVRKLEQRIAQLEAALELHEQRDREQSMCVMYTHEEDEARDARIAQLEQSPEVIAQLEDEKRVMGERITALEAGIRKWASECGKCGGKGFIRHVVTIHRDGYVNHSCTDCADIRALVPNLPASGEG